MGCSAVCCPNEWVRTSHLPQCFRFWLDCICWRPRWSSRSSTVPDHPSEDRSTADGVPAFAPRQILRASSYLRGLALLVALTSAAEGLLDYVFKARASAATSSGEELLRFFAAFYTATALLGILIQVTALRGVLGRLGIARSAALLPAGVSAGAVGAFLVPGLMPIVVARGVEVILRSSLFRAAYELLFTPVEPREKRATKLLVDVGAARVGDAAGGALIQTTLMMVGSGAGRVLLAAAVALSAGALAVARRLHQGYVGALEGSLHRRAGDLPDVVQDDAAALLQTIGGFDLSGIRSRATLFAGTPWMAPPTTTLPHQRRSTSHRFATRYARGKLKKFEPLWATVHWQPTRSIRPSSFSPGIKSLRMRSRRSAWSPLRMSGYWFSTSSIRTRILPSGGGW